VLGFIGVVFDYYSRDGDMSLIGHRVCFDEYEGLKDGGLAARTRKFDGS
jgi:hypothetical protein